MTQNDWSVGDEVPLGDDASSSPKWSVGDEIPLDTPVTARGIARSAASGLLDAAGTAGDIMADPVGNLIGKPLATAFQFGHDALAPVLGYPRYTEAERATLLNDDVPQAGTRAVRDIGSLIGSDYSSASPGNTTERIIRKGVGAGALLSPLGVPGVLAGVSGAVAGDQAAAYSPDWAKPGAEMAGNIAGGVAGGALGGALPAFRPGIPLRYMPPDAAPPGTPQLPGPLAPPGGPGAAPIRPSPPPTPTPPVDQPFMTPGASSVPAASPPGGVRAPEVPPAPAVQPASSSPPPGPRPPGVVAPAGPAAAAPGAAAAPPVGTGTGTATRPRDPTVAPVIQQLSDMLADPRSPQEIAEHEANAQATRLGEYRQALPLGWTMERTPTGNHYLIDPTGAPAIPLPPGAFPSPQAFSDALGQAQQREAANPAPYEAIRRQGNGTQASPVVAQQPTDVAAAAGNVAQPTPAQAAAGNFPMGHVNIGGLPVTIETTAGGTRSGVGPDGTPWSVTMPADYGYIKRTAGADGDHVDVYLGPLAHQVAKHPVFIVDQKHADGPNAHGFDEHKVMLGFPDEASAMHAYRSAFSDGRGEQRIGAVFPTTFDAFRAWLHSGNTKAPIRYKPPGAQLDALVSQAGIAMRPEDHRAVVERIAAGTAPMDALQAHLDMLVDDYVARVQAITAEQRGELEGRIGEFLARVQEALDKVGGNLGGKVMDLLAKWEREANEQQSGGAPKPGEHGPRPVDVPAAGGARPGNPTGTAGQGEQGGGGRPAGQAGGADGGRPNQTRPGQGAPADAGAGGVAPPAPSPPAPKPSKTALAEAFAGEFRDGRKFGNIVQARQFAAGKLGAAVLPGTPEAKMVDEAVELGVVLRAREIAQGGGTPQDRFDALVKLYDQQPTLGTRTSDSIERQAYSTPAPLAFIASHLAGISPGVQGEIYEPTAGNGMLLIAAPQAQTIANELDPERAAALKALGFKATSHDASTWRPAQKAAAVIANPPFGAVKEGGGTSRVFDLGWVQPGYSTHEVDHAIAFRALDAMADDGRAVLILGGVNKQVTTPAGRADAYNGKSKREFYFTLYGKYDVVDHFTVPGELYAKQGAGWPVDVIVIRGRGKSKLPLPSVAAPRIVPTWDALKGLLDVANRPTADGVVTPGGEQPGGGGGADNKPRPGERDEPVRVPAGDGGSRPADAGTGGQSVAPGGKDAGGKPGGRGGVVGPRPVRQPKGGGAGNAGGQPASPAAPAASPGNPAPGQPVAGAAPAAGAGGAAGDQPGGVVGPRSPEPPKPGVAAPSGFGKALLDALDEEMPPGPAATPEAALKEAGDGLKRLFGAGKPRFSVEGTPALDDAVYREALPLFRQAYGALQGASGDTAGLARALIRHARDAWGMTREQIQQMVPYLERYHGEVEAGTEKVVPPAQVSEPEATAPPPDPADQVPPSPRKPPPEPTESQVPYEPASKMRSVDTLVPANMRTAVRDALTDLEKRIQAKYPGGVDSFVADKLGYTADELEQYFSAEQVDALALGIEQIDRGSGFIIGDQTGVGKGRFVAGLIRYAEKKGMVPIFVTEKPNLYADMYRDLTDIGMPGMVDAILPTNSGMNLKLTDEEDGPRLRTPSAKAHALTVSRVASSGDLPPGKRVVFTTYNQLQQIKGANTSRMDLLARLAPGAFIILDEAHNAGGAGIPEDQATAGGKVPRSVFLRRVVRAARAVAFSSATWAKRPDVLDLYGAKTDMRHAVTDLSQLAETITRGGVPMQQIVTAHLARRGQYTRREKSFSGVTYDLHPVEVDRKAYDDVSSALANIFRISSVHAKRAVKEISNEIREEAQSVGGDSGVGDAGASSTSFGAVMHNLINQLLLASKAPGVVALALDRLKAGERPVIALANTMGSFIQEFAEDSGAKPGDPMAMDFNSLLKRYLRRTLRYTVRRPFMARGETAAVHWLTPEDLGPDGEALYRETERMIAALDLAQFPASPIDYIRAKLRAAGYEVGEITGRTEAADYTADGKVLYRTRSGRETSPNARQEAIRSFNRGDTHVMILNQSGATGLSLHASSKFRDQRKRVMLIAQAEPNIDTHMQMLGRVHRTGQVRTPAYLQLVANVPAENRPAAVLAMKMASLSASTTANRRSQMSSDQVVDFLNTYGGQVIRQLLEEQPELDARLGSPTKGARVAEDDGGGAEEGGRDEGEDDPVAVARKVTGRIPLLPLAEQEALYAEIETRYRALLRNLDEAGENALEAKTLDLDARRIDGRTLREATAGGEDDDPFRAAATLDRMDVKRLTRPPSPARIVSDLGKFYEDATVGGEDDWAGQPVDKIGRQISGLSETAGPLNVEGYTEQISSAATDAVERARDTIDDDAKLTQQEARIEANRSRLIDVLTYAVPGRVIELQGIDGTNAHHGLVTNVKLRGDNAVAPSAWDVQVIADDGTRMNIALTNVYTASNAPQGAPPQSARRIGESIYPLEGFLRLMVDGAQQAREERWIATGNILAAFGELGGEGQIVNFTDHAGDLRQGILLPRRFDMERWDARRAPVFSPERAVAFLRTDQGDTPPFVLSSDRGVRIARDSAGSYVITSPRSRERGGAFYLNPGLRNAVGREFVSAGENMRATFGPERLHGVLQALMPILAQRGSNIISTHPAARAFVEADRPRRFVDDQPAAPAAEAETPDPAALAAALEAVRQMTGGQTSTEIGQLPAKARGVTIGRAIRAALSTEIPRVLRHETVHALRNLGVIGKREWASLIAAAEREDWIGKHGIAARYPNATRADQLEEAVGDEFAAWETGAPPKGPLLRAFNALNTGLARIASAVQGRGFQTAADVFGKIERGEVGARPPGSEGPQRGPTTIAESQDTLDRFYGHTARNFPVVDDAGVEHNLAGVDDRDGLPRYSLKEAVDRHLAGTTRAPTPLIDKVRTIPRIGDKLANALSTFADTSRVAQQMVAPMTGGTDSSRADAKQAANEWRDARWTGNQVVKQLMEKYTPAQRKRMYEAVDAERVASLMGQTVPAGIGLSTLSPAERSMVNDLLVAAETAWARARRVGVHDKDGQGLNYVPAMVTGYGTPGAHVVEDIATLALATMRLNEAIAGRVLINRIQAAGARTGMQTISFGGPPGRPDEPTIGISTTTPNVQRRKYLTAEETAEAAAQGTARPDGWFTRPENTAFYQSRWRGTDSKTGDPLFDKVAIWIHPDYRAPLNAILRREYTGRFVYKGLISLKSRMMQTIMFGVSHLAVIAGRALPAAGGNPVGLYRMAREGHQSKNDVVVMRRFIRAGMVPVGRHFGHVDAEGIEAAPNIEPGRSWTAQILAAVPGLVSDRAGTAVKRAVDAAGKFAHETLLWDRVQDIQVGIAIGLERRLMAQGLDPNSATAIAAHFSNRYAGSLPRESMSQAVEELANTALFSRTYRIGGLGMLKDMTGLPKDVQAMIRRNGGPAALKRANSAARRLAIATLAIDLALLNSMYSIGQSALNVAIDAYQGSAVGKAISREAMGYVTRFVHEVQHFPTQANPLNILRNLTPMGDMTEGGGHEPGKEARLLVGYETDGTAIYVRLPIGKGTEDAIAYLTHPWDEVHNILSPFARMASGIWSNDAGFGHKISNPNPRGLGEVAEAAGDIVAWAAGQAGPSIALGAAKKLATGNGGWMDAAKIAGAATGFSISRGYPGGPMEGLLADTRRTQQFKVDRAMPDIKEAIKAGKQADATKLMLAAGIRDPRYQRYIRLHTMNPHMTPRQLQRLTGGATLEQLQAIQGAREFQQERARPAP